MLTLHCAQVLRSAAEFTSGHSERRSSKTTPELSGHYKSHKTVVMCDLTVDQCSSSHCLLALQEEEEGEHEQRLQPALHHHPPHPGSLIIIDLVKQLC